MGQVKLTINTTNCVHLISKCMNKCEIYIKIGSRVNVKQKQGNKGLSFN